MSRNLMRWSVWFFATVGVIAGGIAIWSWATYPEPPDVASSDVSDSLAFMGSDEFNEMYQFHRRRYAMELVEKLREKSFDELIALVMSRNPAHRSVAKNLRASAFFEEVESALFNVMIDKFYEQPEAKRNVYLSVAVMMEGQAMNKRPSAFKIPSPDRLKKDLGQFMSRQPPNVQGKTARLIMDVRKQRQIMGMKDPW